MFKKIQRIHFVGIGGIGMSGIAQVLLNLGYKVSGSDVKKTQIVDALEKLGGIIYIGHNKENIQEADVVVISSAIKESNVEVLEAYQRQIPVIPRAAMLAELMRIKYGIAIAGAHGKTTVTSMVSTILAEGGLDPTIVIGGRLDSLGSNAKLGEGDFIVAEADESDGSFLELSPTVAVITSIDKEHLDYYKDIQEIKEVFLQFMNKVPFYGVAILCLDNEHIQSLIPQVKKRFLTYGLQVQADLLAEDIKFDGFYTEFKTIFRGELLGKVRIGTPGLHNVYNALAAIAVGLELEIDFGIIKAAMEKFVNANRRFQLKGEVNDILIIDDYGHHPTEIEATLATLKNSWDRRIVVIFQPHRYSRTKTLLDDFTTAFYNSDILIITDIYPAGEKPIDGVDASNIFEGVKKHGHKEVILIPDKNKIVKQLLNIIQPKDIVITLGAGDIWEVGEELLKKLK